MPEQKASEKHMAMPVSICAHGQDSTLSVPALLADGGERIAQAC